MIFEQTGGSGPPARLGEAQQAVLKGAVQELPGAVRYGLGHDWNWIHQSLQFVADRFGSQPEPQQLLRTPVLHRLGNCSSSVFKPAAAEGGRNQTGGLRGGVRRPRPRGKAVWTGKIFFARMTAHFRADAELRGKWVLRGEPALVDSSSPRV